MSQAKVDRNKELKKNKKKIVKRQKINRVLWGIAGVIIGAAFLAFVGISGYRTYQTAHADDPLPTMKVNLSAISDYTTALNTDETLDTTSGDTAAEGTADEGTTEEGTEETTENTSEENSEGGTE